MNLPTLGESIKVLIPTKPLRSPPRSKSRTLDELPKKTYPIELPEPIETIEFSDRMPKNLNIPYLDDLREEAQISPKISDVANFQRNYK